MHFVGFSTLRSPQKDFREIIVLSDRAAVVVTRRGTGFERVFAKAWSAIFSSSSAEFEVGERGHRLRRRSFSSCTRSGVGAVACCIPPPTQPSGSVPARRTRSLHLTLVSCPDSLKVIEKVELCWFPALRGRG